MFVIAAVWVRRLGVLRFLKSATLGLRYCIARWKAQSVERPGHLLLVRSGSEPRSRGRACNQRKSGSAAESSEVAPASSLVEP
jgi:hypothetical protein